MLGIGIGFGLWDADLGFGVRAAGSGMESSGYSATGLES